MFQINIHKIMVLKGILSRLLKSAHDLVHSRMLRLGPKHRDGEYIKSVAKMYVRYRQHYYFKLKFLSTNENRHIL